MLMTIGRVSIHSRGQVVCWPRRARRLLPGSASTPRTAQDTKPSPVPLAISVATRRDRAGAGSPELQHRQGAHLMYLGLQPSHRRGDIGAFVHYHVTRAHTCVPGGEVGLEIIGDEIDLP